MATVSDCAGELREDVPLKTGSRASKLCSCDEDFFGGSKFISLAFAVLSVIITIALLIQISYGDYQVTPHGSVATDSRECSAIGTSILKDGGNAVDAAIASAFCLAVVNPHTTGLDAGGQMLIYSHQTRIAPAIIDFSNNSIESSKMPRLILGLAYVHQNYGTLPWKRLIYPAINLAKKGFLVPRLLVSAIQNFKADNLYGFLESGQTISLELLGNFLENVADIPEQDLYKFIANYNRPIESQALVSHFKYYNIYVPGTTAIGLALLLHLQQVEYLNITENDTNKPEYIYTLAKVLKQTYAELNITNNFYYGTSSNIGVMDLNDLYVSLVTGMYAPFGSRRMTSGGYLLDVKVSDIPASRLPLIIVDGDYVCGRRIVLGASDISVASQLITSLLLAPGNATLSIERPRFNILQDELIGVEGSHSPLFKDEVIKYLNTLGKIVLLNEPYNSCNIVEKVGDNLNSHSDSRGGGIANRF